MQDTGSHPSPQAPTPPHTLRVPRCLARVVPVPGTAGGRQRHGRAPKEGGGARSAGGDGLVPRARRVVGRRGVVQVRVLLHAVFQQVRLGGRGEASR